MTDERAEPVQRLSDADLREKLHDALASELEYGAYDCTRVWEAWSVGTMSEDDFVPVTERLDDIVSTVLSAIESALQPGWLPIESAPRDGSKILLAKYGWSNDAGDAVQGSDEWKRRILDQTRRKYGLWWCVAGHWSARWNNWNDGVEPSGLAGPTHWMPLPPAPKATK